MTNRNSGAAVIAGGIVRTLEFCSLRGGPTLLGLLGQIPIFHRSMAVTQVAGRPMRFPAFDAYWCRYLWAGVPYERDVAQIFRKLGKNSVLIDCGANIGYWTVLAPEFGFTDVIAVEANETLIPILRENFDLNAIPGAVLHAAIYSKSGEHLFLDRTAAHAQGGIGEKGMPVTSITIADIVSQYFPDREIVAKLDVEGAEIPAIDGASGVERITFVYEDFPKHDMRVTDELLRRDYSIFGVGPSGDCRRLVSVDEAKAFHAATVMANSPSNLVACPADRAELVESKLTG